MRSTALPHALVLCALALAPATSRADDKAPGKTAAPAAPKDAAAPAPKPATPPGGTKKPADASAVKRPEPDEAGRRASEAIVGYYNALIAKDYDQASSFVHPDFVMPLQVGIATEIEKSSNDKARKGTLDQFGVADVTSLKALSASQFFARFAKSQYGTTLRAISDPALDAKVTTDRILCLPTKTACDVEIIISTVDATTKKRAERRSSVRAQLKDGRWLVGMKPPPPPPPPRELPPGQEIPGH